MHWNNILYEELFSLQYVANLYVLLQIAQLCNKHDMIGQDLVAMCVNGLLVQGAEPLFFHGHFAFGKLDAGVAQLTQAISDGIAEACKLAGCTFLGMSTFKSVFSYFHSLIPEKELHFCWAWNIETMQGQKESHLSSVFFLWNKKILALIQTATAPLLHIFSACYAHLSICKPARKNSCSYNGELPSHKGIILLTLW